MSALAIHDNTSDTAEHEYASALNDAQWRATRDFSVSELSDCLHDDVLFNAVMGEGTDAEVGALVKRLVAIRIESIAQSEVA